MLTSPFREETPESRERLRHREDSRALRSPRTGSAQMPAASPRATGPQARPTI